MTRIISLSEVKKHKNNESCWIVIHNDVYDVTSYLGEHPGGEEALLDVGGKDGTQNFEDVGHSDDAREIMKKYKIGSLPPGESTADKTESVLGDISAPRFEGTTISVYSCEHLPRSQKTEKTWRTFDGSSASQPKPEKQPVCKTTSEPKIVRRVESIVVPKERSNLKWVVLALAGAVVVGFVLKKYLAA